MKKFSIHNLGCKVNSYESEAIASTLSQQGWLRVSEEEPSDASIIFTCAVTNQAASKSRKMMHKIKKQNPQATVCVVGCYSELQDGKLDEADILVGNHDKLKVPELLDAFQKNHQKLRVFTKESKAEYEELYSDQFEGHARGFLKIQDGCNQFCTYCIIPYVRGRERSLDPAKVVQQIQKLSATYQEIVLTGIHTGRYGKDIGTSLVELLEMIVQQCPQLKRLRISSIEVSEIDEALISFIQHHPVIARHLHIPLQAGCDSVLARMHRPYTTQEYLDKITLLRQRIPNIAISADVITGFPQETVDEFMQTVQFIQKCRFSFLHVFPYSKRDGTAASKMPNQVDGILKKQRAKTLLALSDSLKDQYYQSRLDQQDEIIIEHGVNGTSKGYTSDYVEVYLDQEYPYGSIVPVRLVENHHTYMKAEVL